MVLSLIARAWVNKFTLFVMSIENCTCEMYKWNYRGYLPSM